MAMAGVEQVAERGDRGHVARRVAARHQPPVDARGRTATARTARCRRGRTPCSRPRPTVTSRAQPATSPVRLLSTWSAPSCNARSHLSSVPAVASTVAPACLASWMAATETPAPGGVDQHRLAGLQSADVEQRVRRREPARGKRRRVLDRHVVGHGVDVARRRQAQLGVAAVGRCSEHAEFAEQITAAGELRARRRRRPSTDRRRLGRRP